MDPWYQERLAPWLDRLMDKAEDFPRLVVVVFSAFLQVPRSTASLRRPIPMHPHWAPPAILTMAAVPTVVAGLLIQVTARRCSHRTAAPAFPSQAVTTTVTGVYRRALRQELL